MVVEKNQIGCHFQNGRRPKGAKLIFFIHIKCSALFLSNLFSFRVELSGYSLDCKNLYKVLYSEPSILIDLECIQMKEDRNQSIYVYNKTLI
jgi:hypothetical protein